MIAKETGEVNRGENGNASRGKKVGAIHESPLRKLIQRSTLLLRINQINGMAFITSLRAWMGLMALVACLHGRPVGLGGASIVLQVPMAVGASSPFLGMEFVGYEYNPDSLEGILFPSRYRRMATDASPVHEIIAGRKLAGDEISRIGVTIRTGDGGRVDPGGKPHPRQFLVAMAAQAEKRVPGGKPNQAQCGNSRQDEQTGDNQRGGSFGQPGKF
jgi:hypothetical protein